MSHSLLRLSSQIFNTPQLITVEAFTPIVDYLSKRNVGEIEMLRDVDKQKVDDDEDDVGCEVINGVTSSCILFGKVSEKPPSASYGLFPGVDEIITRLFLVQRSNHTFPV